MSFQPSKIMLIGEPMGLFIAQTQGPLETVKGYSCAVAGAEFNVAVGLARLGHLPAYLTKLGDDPFGKLIANVLRENKIGTELVSFTKERSTGFMLKSSVSQGDPEIFYFRKNSAASTLSKEDIDKVDFTGYTHLHMTGILPALTASTREATFHLLQKAKKAGLFISFDPNLRPQLWPSQEEMADTLNELARHCDLLFPGDNEGRVLCGSDDPDKISDFYLARGVKTVVTKVGPRGAYVATSEKRFMTAGFKVDKVVDTVGAGDGFAAGFLSGLMEGLSLEACALRGNAVGAIQVTSRGDNDGLPQREALAAFMGAKQNLL